MLEQNQYLERINSTQNMHRFYSLSLTKDLFGIHILTRRWGRIGSQFGGRGRTKCETFYDVADAHKQMGTLIAQKMRRGYTPV